MPYFKITLKSIPRIAFAHEYKARQYSLQFPVFPNEIELNYPITGNLVKQTENYMYHTPERGFLFNILDEPSEVSSDAEIHSHYCIRIVGAFEKTPVSEDELIAYRNRHFPLTRYQEEVFFAPVCLSSERHTEAISRYMYTILMLNKQLAPYVRNIARVGVLFELFAHLTEACVSEITDSDGGFDLQDYNLYVERAQKHILFHIHERLSVPEIARQLNISTGYLSSTFKRVTGQSIVEYINEQKIRRIGELIMTNNMTLAQAGAAVSMTDPSYLSRLFKRVTGSTVSAFKQNTFNRL